MYKKLASLSAAAVLVYLVLVSTLFVRHLRVQAAHDASSAARTGIVEFTNNEIVKTSTPGLPVSYQDSGASAADCERVYGLPYLYNLRDSYTPYCKVDSPSTRSNLECFRTSASKSESGRTDSFCVANNAEFLKSRHKFRVDCDLHQIDGLHDAPRLEQMPDYMYSTGPANVMRENVDFTPVDEQRKGEIEGRRQCSQYKVLIKREGAGNLWHCLLEIFSLYLTLDTLAITPMNHSSATSAPFFQGSNVNDTQVVILDQHPDGPFFELWGLFSGKPTVRMSELASTEHSDECTHNLIIPLPGGSNPLWYSDWHPQGCITSALLKAFVSRLQTHYSTPTAHNASAPLTLTIIDRNQSRKLQDLPSIVSRIQSTYPALAVQVVDFATLSFPEQIALVAQTDILFGVHGAGLAHSMFLPPDSAVIEIFPEELSYPVFRNLAKLCGHRYASDHGKKLNGLGPGGDWHGEDVAVDVDNIMAVVDVAVKGMYNSGTRTDDVI